MPEEKSTKFCSNCKAEIDIKAKICPKCGVEQPIIPGKVSNWWYLVPVFLGIVGGLIAWVINKDVNPRKAKKLLIIGIVVPIVWIIIYVGVTVPIVLISMNRTRERSQDARIMAEMSQIRSAAVIVFDKEDNYSMVSCAHPEIAPMCQDVKTQSGEDPTIHSAQKEYCVYAKLLSGDYYCMDSKGTAKKTSIYPGGTRYCDGRTFVCP